MKIKKSSSIFLAVCLLISSCIFINKADASSFLATGYNDVAVDSSAFVVDRAKTVFSVDRDLPSKFSLIDLGLDTSVKNQNPYGTCWTFATMASAEGSALLKNQEKEIDLSELQLAYFFYNRNDDPLHLTTGDTNIALNQSTGEVLELSELLNLGGNTYVASVGIAGGLGFINESLLSYSEASSVSSGNLPDSKLAYDSNSYLTTSAYWLSMSDKETIKEVLMNYGSVAFSIYYSNDYYNSSNHAHYCYDWTKIASTNHAVTIVGWDDDYSRTNFGSSIFSRPASDGAWLVKNSWGSSWGDEGYFWVSYSDLSIGSMGIKFCVEEVDENYYIYQYDGTASVGSLSDSTKIAKSANIYTAQSDSYLDKVGYFDMSAGTSYTIKIYTNLTDANDPLSGNLVYTSEGKDEYAGYNTHDLTEYVKINKDSLFSVVVEQSVNSGTISLCVDCDQNYGWIKFNNESKEGESYFAFGDEEFEGKTYTNDDGDTEYYTARIKAYAIDIPEWEYSKTDQNKLVKYNGSSLSELYIPQGTTSISDGLFSDCDSITTVVIPEGVTTIGKDFCKNCENIISVSLPSTLESIGEGSFENVNVTNLSIPDSLKVIDQEYIEPKCETDGATLGYHCSLCESLKIDSQSIEKLDHDFNNYISNNDADFYSDGTKTSKCSRCDKTDTVDDIDSKKIPKVLSIISKGYGNYYHLGDEFNLGSTLLKIEDDSDYFENVDANDTVFNGFDSDTAGEKIITFEYLGIETQDTVIVVDYTLGDVNGDDSVDDMDAIAVLMNCYFPEDYALNQAADFNNDGETTDSDAIYLLMHSYFPDDYPIYDFWELQ